MAADQEDMLEKLVAELVQSVLSDAQRQLQQHAPPKPPRVSLRRKGTRASARWSAVKLHLKDLASSPHLIPAPEMCDVDEAEEKRLLDDAVKATSEGSCNMKLSTILKQIETKTLNKGIRLNLMLIGESGIGKSSLANSLFNAPGFSKRESPSAQNLADRKTLTFSEEIVEVADKDNDLSLQLHVIDTIGFGDPLDCSAAAAPICQYIEHHLEQYLVTESAVCRRGPVADSRVHAVIYMLSPHARGLRPIDLYCLHALNTRVNLIPVIGKADTLTTSELCSLKNTLRGDFSREEITLYRPANSRDLLQTAIMAAQPLAIVSPNETIKTPEGPRQVRSYPWGNVLVEDTAHCDFLRLRALLITNLVDLVDSTHNSFYETYRATKLHNFILYKTASRKSSDQD